MLLFFLCTFISILYNNKKKKEYLIDVLRSIICIAKDIDDQRIERTTLHKLTDIMSIVICAMICGFTGWEQFELFALSRVRWLIMV